MKQKLLRARRAQIATDQGNRPGYRQKVKKAACRAAGDLKDHFVRNGRKPQRLIYAAYCSSSDL